MDISFIFIISQVIGAVAFFISLLAYHKRNKKGILSFMILSNILNLIHYFLLGAFSGCLTKIVAIIRDNIIIFKDKNKFLSSRYFIYLFIAIYIILGFISFKNIWSIFPIIAAIIYLIPVWDGGELKIKKTAFGCYFLWLVYNIIVFSISGIISNIISIISTYIAIYNFKKFKS